MAERFVIAADCDDVLIESVHPIMAHYNQNWGTQLTAESYYQDRITQQWGSDDPEEVGRRINSYLLTDHHLDFAPDPETVEIIGRLAQENDFHVITGRPSYVEDVTRIWLEKYYGDIFKTVTLTNAFTDKAVSKAVICQQLGADFFVEDHTRHAHEVAAAGIQTLLFGNYPWNVDYQLEPGMQRALNWKQVEDIINHARQR